MLSDSVDKSYCWGGLSASNSSSVTDRVSASQGAVGVPNFSGMTLALGRGFWAQVLKNVFDRGECICCRGRL